MEFQWDKIREPGLPCDKEIINNSEVHRVWVAQAAIARTLSEVVDYIENAEERIEASLKAIAKRSDVDKINEIAKSALQLKKK